MKVAIVSDWYPPKLGGVETLVYEMSKYMAERPEVEVEVITQDFSGTFSFSDKFENENDVKVRRLAGITEPFWNTYFHPELPFKIKRIFKEEDYDVVHTHHFFTLLSVLSTAVADRMNPRIKCVVATNHTYHEKSDSFLFKVPKFVSSFTGESADRIFVGSDAAAELVEDVCDSSKIRKIEYGVPLDSFDPEKRSQSLREETGVYSDPMILYVGRFGKRKGVEYLLKALGQKEDDLGDFRLVLIGSGPREKKYRRMIDDMSIGDRVDIEGYVEREMLQKFYASSDLAVFPSVRDESFGRVIPEAMASGKPYIATDIPGFNEVHGEGAGYLVPPADSEALAEKILYLCENEDLRKKMGERGRELAEDRFNWNDIVDRILEAYNEVLD